MLTPLLLVGFVAAGTALAAHAGNKSAQQIVNAAVIGSWAFTNPDNFRACGESWKEYNANPSQPIRNAEIRFPNGGVRQIKCDMFN